jgi:hypothetical protein
MVIMVIGKPPRVRMKHRQVKKIGSRSPNRWAVVSSPLASQAG